MFLFLWNTFSGSYLAFTSARVVVGVDEVHVDTGAVGLTRERPYLLRPGGACPAGFVSGADVVAGAGASIGAGDEAEDNCSNPLDVDGRCAGPCAPAGARGTATRLDDGRGELSA